MGWNKNGQFYNVNTTHIIKHTCTILYTHYNYIIIVHKVLLLLFCISPCGLYTGGVHIGNINNMVTLLTPLVNILTDQSLYYWLNILESLYAVVIIIKHLSTTSFY